MISLDLKNDAGGWMEVNDSHFVPAKKNVLTI